MSLLPSPPLLILLILATTAGLFLWGRFRHDLVAVLALLACVAFGLVPAREAFAGFGHPAVITVAAVLILSAALEHTGAARALVARVMPGQAGAFLSLLVLCLLGATLSAFMNNVGAMALLMPAALHTARRLDLRPGLFLMPLAFATVLGGITTLIGTPPNLIVSGFRAQHNGGVGFGMFDFTPVGVAVALAGVLFTVLAARWLVPQREGARGNDFVTGQYITEVRLAPGSKLDAARVGQVQAQLTQRGARLVGLVRREMTLPHPHPNWTLQVGDVLRLLADAQELDAVLADLDVQLVRGADGADSAKATAAPVSFAAAAAPAAPPETTDPDDLVLQEWTVMPRSDLVGQTASGLRLQHRHGVRLLALSRQAGHGRQRLRETTLEAGDVLLLQATPAEIAAFAQQFNLVPLAPRGLRVSDPRKAWLAALALAVPVGVASLGWLPSAVAFVCGVAAVMMLRLLPLDRLYDAVDWPVIVLLGALMPVADAMATTGAAEQLARLLMDSFARGNPVIALALILIVTMTLSDFMNNAATAAVMCPIAIGVAQVLGARPDSFLMAVAIGASCAFLTPIGHQNNTLILGPGGFRFGDYWRLGLPLEILVVALSLPLLLWAWPLQG